MLPSDGAFDSTLALLREGYTFIGARCDRLHTDAFSTRLVLTRAICLRGADAARLFYSSDRFTRVDAMPRSVLHLLQDTGSVQLLDGAPHRHRKQLFIDILEPAAIDRLREAFRAEFEAAVPRWEKRARLALHEELYGLLTRAALAFTGVTADDGIAERRTREFRAMIEHSGSVGPRNRWAQWQRRHCERWARELILAQRRDGSMDASPVSQIAHHIDLEGKLLDPGIAAVELINVLRPIAAVVRFITFAALALHEHPHWRAHFAAGHDGDLEPFSQEVRRFYPFFPFIGGRSKADFEWSGIRFKAGTWTLLDLYGTNRDPRLWEDPQSFRPERFRDWPDDAFTLIPQGAGDYVRGHRCPGERATIELVKDAIRLLCRSLDYSVPAQDLTLDLAAIPALPRSGFIIADVRARPAVSDTGRN